MIVAQYDRNAARKLAAAIVAGAASPLTRAAGPADTRVIDVGSGWHMSTWREHLRRLTDRGNVTALTLRTGPHERQLSDTDWAQVTGGLATRIGLTQRPWAAVRTGATTVTLLTDAASGPVSRAAALDYVRNATIALRHPTVGQPDKPTPLPVTPTVGPFSKESDNTAVARGLAQLSFAAPADTASDTSATTPSQPTAMPATPAASRARGR